MDALILSCGTGGGHNTAARAVEEAFAAHGANVTFLDPYTLKSEKTSNTINNTYINIVQKVPRVFGLAYSAGNIYRRLPIHSPVYLCNKKMAGTLAEYLDKNHFDVIIMTHVFPAEILKQMKDQGMDVPSSVFVATDYACIPFTEETECDAYIIPTASHREEFIKRGIPEGKIYPFGIPVSSKFIAPGTKEQAREALGLEKDRKYVLISGGSMGAGDIHSVIRKLADKNIGLIVICGSNQSLYDKLNEEYGKKLTLLHYTDKMASYMRACDLFLTKPGGLSSTEAAVMGVPLVHLPPIPGCETINARFFSENGMSLNEKKTFDADAIVSALNDEGKLISVVENQYRIIPRNSAEKIYGLALEIIK